MIEYRIEPRDERFYLTRHVRDEETESAIVQRLCAFGGRKIRARGFRSLEEAQRRVEAEERLDNLARKRLGQRQE